MNRLNQWIENITETINFEGIMDDAIAGVVVLIAALIVNVIAKKIILKVIYNIVHKTSVKWDEKIYERRVFHRLSHIPAAMVIYVTSGMFNGLQEIIEKLAVGYILIIALLAVLSLLDALVDIYNHFPFAKNRPIKSIVQMVKLFFYALVGILLLGNFTDSGTALALLSTLGGMTAILLLVFNDSILGLVAGIQLTANQALKIGDWIEMPSQGTDGEVIDISLNKIKVQNWDKTISNIPAQNFLKEAFKNWEGMEKAGGRRIKRAILIDISSIKFLDQELYGRMEKIAYLRPYLKQKEAELANYNEKVSSDSLVNQRRLTNIGTFRAYIKAYLEHHPEINQDLTMLVRQLAPTEQGIPIEIYAFSNVTAWNRYEAIQSDIIDHLFSIINEFELKVYQCPTSYDFKH